MPSEVRKIFLYYANYAFGLLQVIGMLLVFSKAYNIRLHAVNEYGAVIHEFDPYFNFRATEYLVANGWNKFINWYDERSWYPLGRPVGTTIYPGLQALSAAVYYILPKIGWEMSLNDVCVYQPAWFAIVTCSAVFGITYEATRSANAGVFAAFIMAIVPAHIMRSVAGGYDNESIAIGAMCLTFYFWVRSLRNEKSWWFGFLTALSYVFMVAAWGGYVFVLNMIGVHAAFMMFVNYTPQLHISYSLFYVLGTIGAIQFPVVGLAPLKSLEQLGPMFVFFLMHLRGYLVFEYKRMVEKNGDSLTKYTAFVMKLLGLFFGVLVVVVAILAPTGYFGPLSSRIRGLFVQHTRTGNPLVDSVAEHQATHSSAYAKFFQDFCLFSPMAVVSLLWSRNDAKYFVLLYSLIAAYFSRKMNRLMLLLSAPASILGGIFIAGVFEWCFSQLLDIVLPENNDDQQVGASAAPKDLPKSGSRDSIATKNDRTNVKPKKQSLDPIESLKTTFGGLYRGKLGASLRFILSPLIFLALCRRLVGFYGHSDMMAEMLSNPSIIIKANYQDGRTVYLDDFREAYWWLRDNTPEDARVMSWWDYGYQIAQIANRTTLADGNTWNHEHIALLGKILVSNITTSHSIVRHLADYVLVWSTRFAGNPGDDIAKSPHMARIGGSVYKDIKADQFGMDRQGRPSPMMRDSLVYNLVLNQFDQNVPALPPKTFKEAFTSSHRMVRIYKVLGISKDSKKYCAENRGYIAWKAGKPGFEAYPPGLRDVLAGKKDFEQLEDFNAKKGAKKEAEEAERLKRAAEEAERLRATMN